MLGLGFLTLTLTLIPKGIVAIVFSLSDWSRVAIGMQAIVLRLLVQFSQSFEVNSTFPGDQTLFRAPGKLELYFETSSKLHHEACHK